MAYDRTKTTQLLAALNACTDHTTYWSAYRAVESHLNWLDHNGFPSEATDARPEFVRINRAVRPRIEAIYAAIPRFTNAELIARSRAAEAATNAALAQIKATHAETASLWGEVA